MNVEDFTATSIALLRSAVGWQSAIARRLGVDSRTVRRWLAGGEVPRWAEEKLAEMIGAADLASPFPRDEWLLGDALGGDGRRREYIHHLQPPRFTARIVVVDDDGLPEPGEEPADVASGAVYSIDEETVLCELAWIDEPDPGEIVRLLEAAADEIERVGLADAPR